MSPAWLITRRAAILVLVQFEHKMIIESRRENLIVADTWSIQDNDFDLSRSNPTQFAILVKVDGD